MSHTNINGRQNINANMSNQNSNNPIMFNPNFNGGSVPNHHSNANHANMNYPGYPNGPMYAQQNDPRMYPNNGYEHTRDNNQSFKNEFYPAQDERNNLYRNSYGDYVFDGNDQYVNNSMTFNDHVDKMIQNAFIRKVLGLVGFMLLLTFSLAFIGVVDPAVTLWFNQHPVIGIVAGALYLGISLYFMYCSTSCKSAKVSIPLLFILSACIGVLLLYISGVVPTQILLSATLTFLAILAFLTGLAFTKHDFTKYSTYLFVGFIVVGIMSVVGIFWKNHIYQVLITGFSILVVSFSIVFNLQRIIKGKHARIHFSVNDYALAAVSLYVDVITLFINILNLFLELNRNSE